MSVKPVFSHGIDVTELPGFAGWLVNLLAIAFEETLVEPNMLVVDLEKFVSPQSENWFSMDVKENVAQLNVEVIEAAELKPADLNGLADPYVRGHMGPYRFKTQIQRKTLTPKWQEEFRVPICSWDSQNILEIQVRDKDRFLDDILGNCSVNISGLTDGKRHDMWLPLENVKMGRLHLAVTVITIGKETEKTAEDENEEEKPDSQKDLAGPGPISTKLSNNSQKVADTFEAIDVKGQKETGIWVHHPGRETSQAWEPRKGKSRHIDSEIASVDTPKSSRQPSVLENSSSDDGSKESRRRKLTGIFQKGIDKMLHKHPKIEDHLNGFGLNLPSPHANVKPVHVKKVGLNLVMDEEISEPISGATEGNGPENSSKHDMKSRAKDMLKNVGKSTRQLRQKLSKKGSSKFFRKEEERAPVDSDSSDDDGSLASSRNDHPMGGIRITSSFITRDDTQKAEPDDADHAILANTQREVPENSTPNCNLDGPCMQKDVKANDSEGNSHVPIEESLKLDSPEGKIVENQIEK